jgi:hypothetical protein
MNALTQATKRQKQFVSQPPTSQSLISQPLALQPIRQKLIFAQQRLQDRSLPLQLAALSYLRITCAAMQTAQHLGYLDYGEAPAKTPYLTLLRQLGKQSSSWWQLCQVSETGHLISSDRQIQTLLQPLNAFAAQVLEPLHEYDRKSI